MDSRPSPIKSARITFSKTIRNLHFWLALGITIVLLLGYYFHADYLVDGPIWLWKFRTREVHYSVTGSLLYIPFIYSAITLSLGSISIIWLIAIVAILPQVIYFSFSAESFLSNILFLSIPLIIVSIIKGNINFLRKERQVFQDREAERQSFMAQLIVAQEAERKRIAQELHDDTIQALLALANEMQYPIGVDIEESQLRNKISQQLNTYRSSIYSIAEEVRRLSIDLRPSILDDIGLLEAIRWLVDKMSDERINIRMIVNGQSRKFTSENEVIIFRFIQEALNNAKHHSKASKAFVQIDFEPSSIIIKVQDNGIGFVVPENLGNLSKSKKMGIIGMAERAKLLGGEFHVTSQPGEGALVSLKFKQ